MGDIFLFFGVFEIPDIFGVKGRCWVRAYVCRKIESTPLGCVLGVNCFRFIKIEFVWIGLVIYLLVNDL